MTAEHDAPALDEFLTVAEVAGILKLNPQTIRNWIDNASSPRSASAAAFASVAKTSRP